MDEEKFTSEYNLSEQAFRKLMRVSRLIRQIMEPFFQGYGISISQWATLRNLYEWEEKNGEPARLVDLSAHMLIRQPTLTAVINKLALLGMVERIKPSGDRRERRVVLTPKGRGLVLETLDLRKEKIENLLKTWDMGEKRLALDLLDKLMGELETKIRSNQISG